MPDPFSYDVVAYPGHAVAAMQPDRLYVQGRLFGLAPARPETCRYLEVGCGSGTNLISAALQLPGSEFVGLDLAAGAVREGQATAAALGVINVTLHHADLTTWEPDGPFDYVAAHGVYSWVPEPVRDRLMALVGRALTPAGVGYVSFNTLPGCHLRRVVWDMLKFHTASIDDPAAKLAQAGQFLHFLIAGQEGQSAPPHRWLEAEAGSVLERVDSYLTFHDDLAAVNDPVYLIDFAGHAGRHGLRFLADAELPTMSDEVYPPAVAAVLGDLRRQNPLVREQYRDFLSVRRFRTTLVCRAAQPVRPDPDPAAVDELLVVATVRPVGEPADGEPAEFLTETGASTTAGDPAVAALLTRLAAVAPARVAVADLGADRRLVLATARAGLTRLHAVPTPAVGAAGERPAVSRLARYQAAHGQRISTLLHTTLDLGDPASEALLPLLDGTRSRAELAEALRAAVPTLGTAEEVADGLDIALDKLAKAGMLTA